MASERERVGWERLADVHVPKGILWWLLLAVYLRQRNSEKVFARFGDATDEFGAFIGNRMRQSDERSAQVVELQGSVERLTRRLVTLTVVLGLIGLAGIAVSVWAIVR